MISRLRQCVIAFETARGREKRVLAGFSAGFCGFGCFFQGFPRNACALCGIMRDRLKKEKMQRRFVSNQRCKCGPIMV